MNNKVLILLVALLTASALPSSGQDGYWVIEAGIGSSTFDRSGGNAEISGTGSSREYSSGERTVSYHSSPVVLPTFAVSGGYKFGDSFVGLFLNVYGNFAWSNLDGGPAPLKEKETILHVLPEVRMYYMDTPNLKLFAAAGAGFRYRQFTETLEGDAISNSDFRFSWQFAPFGVSIGEHWHFTVATGYGRPWTGCFLSGGYRF